MEPNPKPHKEKTMAVKGNRHWTATADMRLAHPARDIWPLLCQVREYDWIAHWDCEVVHTESGINELGCVFRTDFPAEGPETWLTSRYEPCSRLEFVRTGRDRIIRFEITLEADGNGTALGWTHHVTALSEEGAALFEGYAKRLADNMALLERMLGHYLDTGEMFRPGT
jgi:hypothetical protein